MEKILTTKMKLKTKRMYLIQLIPPWTIFSTLCFVRCCCRQNNNLTDCDQRCHTQSIKWQVKGWQETGFSDCQDLSVFQVTEGMSRWWQERGNDLSSNQMMVKMTHNNNGIRVLCCCYCCLWVACLMLMTLSIQRKRMMMRWGWDAGCTDEARETNRGKRLGKSLVREINEEKGLYFEWRERQAYLLLEKSREHTQFFSCFIPFTFSGCSFPWIPPPILCSWWRDRRYFTDTRISFPGLTEGPPPNAFFPSQSVSLSFLWLHHQSQRHLVNHPCSLSFWSFNFFLRFLTVFNSLSIRLIQQFFFVVHNTIVIVWVKEGILWKLNVSLAVKSISKDQRKSESEVVWLHCLIPT